MEKTQVGYNKVQQSFTVAVLGMFFAVAWIGFYLPGLCSIWLSDCDSTLVFEYCRGGLGDKCHSPQIR